MRARRAVAAAVALLALALACALPALADVVQRDGLRVAVEATMTPRALPRSGEAPVAVAVSGRISAVAETALPQLQRLTIEINRHGHFDFAGLPVCAISEIQPATNSRALGTCGPALVGQGSFSAQVVLQGEPPYQTKGRLLVFNGREGGHPVLFGHIYTAQPFSNSFVITFRIEPIAKGTFGTALVASLPRALGNWGYVTGIEMNLGRRWSAGGRSHSYLSAGCPAPRGFPGATFPLARTSFAFAGGTHITQTLTGSCRAR
jgi:hypothetical protein